METPPRQVIQIARNPHTIGLRSIYKEVNQNTPAGKEARRFFESTKGRIQCERVLENVKPRDCWLCGLDFKSGDSIQCEHVLPFPQGPIFLEIYQAKYGDTITDSMKLEYDYAHAYCNNVKNKAVFVVGDEKGYYPNVEAIADMCQTLKKAIPAMNVEDQVFAIQGRIIEICDFINKTLEITPEGFHVFKVGKQYKIQFTKPSVAKKLDMAAMETDGGRRKRTKRNKRRRHTRRR